MKIIDRAKIHLYINERMYLDLSLLLNKKEENNEYLYDYITQKFSNKENAICGYDLVKLLGCMSDKYVLKTIEQLITEPNFSYICFELILKSEKLNSAISINRKKYLKCYLEKLDFMGIIRLYNNDNISEEDKTFIETTLYSKILNAKNAFDLAFTQQLIGTEIVPKSAIEKAILNAGEAKYLYGLMSLRGYDKNKLITKLSEIKELDSNNKKYFLMAVSEYYPSEISKIPFGEFVEEIVCAGLTIEDNAMIMTKASNAIAVMQSEKKQAISYSDDEQVKKDNIKKYNDLY